MVLGDVERMFVGLIAGFRHESPVVDRANREKPFC